VSFNTLTGKVQHIFGVIRPSLNVSERAMQQPAIMPGDEIRKWRETFGWSQAELARRANTNQQTVDRIERGLTKHSRSAGAITEVIRKHFDVLEGRLTRSGDIIKANYKLKASPVPTLEHSFPVFIYENNTVFGLAQYSQIPTAFVDNPGDYAIQVFADDLPLGVQRNDYLFFDNRAPVELGRFVFCFKHARPNWRFVLGVLVEENAETLVVKTSSTSGAKEIISRDDFHVTSAISIFSLRAPLAESSI
jgi:transcriptional regulator with XRE-family HTH domain